MDDLKFPVPKEPLPPSRVLTMDEYLEFVMMLRLHPPPKLRPDPENEPPPRYVRFRLE